jgi:hypothetical protein
MIVAPTPFDGAKMIRQVSGSGGSHLQLTQQDDGRHGHRG